MPGSPFNSKSASAEASKPLRLLSPPRSKSEEQFHQQYKDAPRKIFVRPPCEQEYPPEDPTVAVIAACNHASFVLQDRFYSRLIRRQLTAVDTVLELQADRPLHIEQIESFSACFAALLSRTVVDDASFSVYAERLVCLIEMSGRKIVSNSQNVSAHHAGHVCDLFDTLGQVISQTGNKLHNVYVPVIRSIVDYVVDEVAVKPDTEFARSCTDGLTESGLVPALIQAFPMIMSDGALTVPVMTIFADIQDFMPKTKIVMLENYLVDHLLLIFDSIWYSPSEVMHHREPMFFASGLLLHMVAVDFAANALLLEKVLANERVVSTVHRALRRYFPTVHETDREIRNTLAAVEAVFMRIATSSPALQYVVDSCNLPEWHVQVTARPEVATEHPETGHLRMQMHKKDVELKKIFLHNLVSVWSSNSTRWEYRDVLEAITVQSFFYYLVPFTTHKRAFWAAKDYESIRLVVMEVFALIYPHLAKAYKLQNGNGFLMGLLKGETGLDKDLYESNPKNVSAHSTLTVASVKMVQTVLRSDATEEETILEFCIGLEGVLELLKILESARQEMTLDCSSHSIEILRYGLTALSSVSKKSPEVLQVVRQLGAYFLLQLLDFPFNLSRPRQLDIVVCIFTSISTWIAGEKDLEMRFLAGKGAEKVCHILSEALPSVQLELIEPIEQIFLQSFRITKYLEFLPDDKFLHALHKLWEHEEARPALHSIYVLLRSTWERSTLTDTRTNPEMERYVRARLRHTIFSYIRTQATSGIFMSEVKKLILVLKNSPKAGLSSEVHQIIQGMHEYSEYLPDVLVEVYIELTGTDPLADSLYAEGNDDSGQMRVLYSRSNNSLFMDTSNA